MKAAIRQLKIRHILETQEFVDFRSLCGTLEASESSIRRDLVTLESGGVIRRVYGGAMAVQASNSHLLDFDFQSSRMREEKKRIAQVAAGLLEDGQTVILDGGSTVAALARELVGRSLHVLTNSLPIADIFSEARLRTGTPWNAVSGQRQVRRFTDNTSASK